MLTKGQTLDEAFRFGLEQHTERAQLHRRRAAASAAQLQTAADAARDVGSRLLALRKQADTLDAASVSARHEVGAITKTLDRVRTPSLAVEYSQAADVIALEVSGDAMALLEQRMAIAAAEMNARVFAGAAALHRDALETHTLFAEGHSTMASEYADKLEQLAHLVGNNSAQREAHTQLAAMHATARDATVRAGRRL